jgi:hypothetical protein
VLKETDHKSHIVFEALRVWPPKSLQQEGHPRRAVWTIDDFWNGWTTFLEDGKSGKTLESFGKMYQQHIATVVNPDAKAKFRLRSDGDDAGAMVNNSIGPSLPWIRLLLSGLAGIIMRISCFNFTIANSPHKAAKEIGSENNRCGPLADLHNS